MAANSELREQVVQAIADNEVLVFMKGTPEAPRCGFSMRTVQVLESMGVQYGAIDVLPVLQPLREVTTEISDWGTFPQVYVKGELIGGCDIVEEMYETGELATMLGVEQPDEDPSTDEPVEGKAGPYQSPPMQIETQCSES